MIGHFYFKQIDDRILVTNELGKYVFLSLNEFNDLINDKIESNSNIYATLKENMFLYDSSTEKYIEDISYQLRESKSYLFSAPSLHIFVVTNYCNAKCIYCQAQSSHLKYRKVMSKKVATKAVELALQTPQKTVSFEFQGGEPLSNFEIIKYIVEYSQKIKRDKTIYYSIVTNLTFLTDDMLHFFRKYNMSISTSLDGFEAIHNYNRPLLSSGNSFKVVSESLIKIRKTGINCGAIQTTTRAGLNYPEELIDEYLRQGINNIFIRPLTPLGIAAEKWSEIGYFAEEFVEFYEKCLNYIIAKNKAGVKIKEGHASIFLSKILHGYGINYMELRSPCGAGIGQIAYYYDGDIYTCDEGRMRGEAGDTTFLLGNVFNNTYNDLMESNVCKVVCKYSILESLPKCCDCVYSPYCGVCPVINYALENDIISQKPQNYKCKLYAGMLDTIFNLLKDEENKRIMEEWV